MAVRYEEERDKRGFEMKRVLLNKGRLSQVRTLSIYNPLNLNHYLSNRPVGNRTQLTEQKWSFL